MSILQSSFWGYMSNTPQKYDMKTEYTTIFQVICKLMDDIYKFMK
ncbi:hypothetical protein HMPREF9445_00267 [Bacteroides clarus YIT 12056]|uniref:Uncharacterized protein n=1 Tax=Bacteroides clarus YIT 12056 TaxID=762984 RepID=A0ABN0CRY6_9BACE|nr:hypothetical protein HMPREF9445_00267 [Bacteroides clarus YIT 12056]